jgi:hypothetical protein
MQKLKVFILLLMLSLVGRAYSSNVDNLCIKKTTLKKWQKRLSNGDPEIFNNIKNAKKELLGEERKNLFKNEEENFLNKDFFVFTGGLLSSLVALHHSRNIFQVGATDFSDAGVALGVFTAFFDTISKCVRNQQLKKRLLSNDIKLNDIELNDGQKNILSLNVHTKNSQILGFGYGLSALMIGFPYFGSCGADKNGTYLSSLTTLLAVSGCLFLHEKKSLKSKVKGCESKKAGRFSKFSFLNCLFSSPALLIGLSLLGEYARGYYKDGYGDRSFAEIIAGGFLKNPFFIVSVGFAAINKFAKDSAVNSIIQKEILNINKKIECINGELKSEQKKMEKELNEEMNRDKAKEFQARKINEAKLNEEMNRDKAKEMKEAQLTSRHIVVVELS